MIDGKIYKITNIINGKVYIGQTIRLLQERFERHLRDARNNKYPENHFHRAIRKYGAESFVIEQIDSASTQKELNEKEIYWISKFNSKNKALAFLGLPKIIGLINGMAINGYKVIIP